jgi:hypothetical protein
MIKWLLKSVFALGLIINSVIASAQKKDSTYYSYSETSLSRRFKSIYVELLGSSGFTGSLNFDMRFKPGHSGWGFRSGITKPVREGNATTYSFPLLVNRVTSNHRVAFEYGIGVILAYRRYSYQDSQLVVHHVHGFEYPATANVGIRFQPIRTGLVWRVYWAPSWHLGDSFQRTVFYWFGTSLGIGFN